MRIIFIGNTLIILILILYIILPVTIYDTLFSSGPLFLVYDSSSWINIRLQQLTRLPGSKVCVVGCRAL